MPETKKTSTDWLGIGVLAAVAYFWFTRPVAAQVTTRLLPGGPPTQPTPQQRAGGTGGGSGGGFGGGSGGGFAGSGSSSRTGGAGQTPTGRGAPGGPTYSPGAPQPGQLGQGLPYGPRDPTTDPCNQASPYYDEIGCVNVGGSEYYGSYGPVTTPPYVPPTGPAPADTGDPCDQSSSSFDAMTCINQSGVIYDSYYYGPYTGGYDSGGSTDNVTVTLDYGYGGSPDYADYYNEAI